ncbi:MAG TPA: DMT family transporter [Streptomyces sp.]
MGTTSAIKERTSRYSKIAGALVAAGGGLGLAVQGRLNGQLGARLHDGIGAALFSFGTGLVLLIVMVAAMPRARAGVARLRTAVKEHELRWWECLGGLCGAFFVTAQGITITALGVAVFTVAVVAGQTASGLVVDRAGIGPGHPRPITPPRALGAAIAVVAVLVSVSGDFAHPSALWLAVLPALAGIGMSWQQAVNGLVRDASANVVVPTAINFGIGTVGLLVAFAVDLVLRGLPEAPPADWWLYLGGPLGIVAILSMVVAVRLVGVLLLGLCSVAGQLIGALVLDLVTPAADGGLTLTSVLGAAITLVAVVVAALSTPGPTPGRPGSAERDQPAR